MEFVEKCTKHVPPLHIPPPPLPDLYPCHGAATTLATYPTRTSFHTLAPTPYRRRTPCDPLRPVCYFDCVACFFSPALVWAEFTDWSRRTVSRNVAGVPFQFDIRQWCSSARKWWLRMVEMDLQAKPVRHGQNGYCTFFAAVHFVLLLKCLFLLRTGFSIHTSCTIYGTLGPTWRLV